MSKYGEGDRFQYEGDEPTQAERDEAEMRLAKVEELRELSRSTFLTIGRELEAIRMLNRQDPRLGSADAEIIEGAAEQAEELFDRMLSASAVKDAEGVRDYEP